MCCHYILVNCVETQSIYFGHLIIQLANLEALVCLMCGCVTKHKFILLIELLNYKKSANRHTNNLKCCHAVLTSFFYPVKSEWIGISDRGNIFRLAPFLFVLLYVCVFVRHLTSEFSFGIVPLPPSSYTIHDVIYYIFGTFH